MPVDKTLVANLKAEIQNAQNDLDTCYSRARSKREEFLRNVGAPGPYHGPAPDKTDCSAEEQRLASLQDDLKRAEAGQQPLPGFLSADGRVVFKDIERRGEVGPLLVKTILLGTALSEFETLGAPSVATGGRDLTDTADAVQAIPKWIHNDNVEEIKLHLVQGKKLSTQERRYWERVLRDFGATP